ncbi:GNAT family N-acetyltransferase [Chitinimonas sp. JJ19]|uniref:GNAT family N-acetyltransferase n=1 Tax=Chitinimonas sp. JJ19 TaxID=3109352 RepID=UPI003001F146
MLSLHPARMEDAEAYLAFFARLIATADTMLPTPQEYQSRTAAEIASTFSRFAEQDNQLFLLAWQDGQLAGFITVTGGMARKNRGCGYIVTGVDVAFRRKGVGRALFAAAEAWAREAGFWRLELTVMAHNEAAQQLYLAAGFTVEGCKRAALCWDDRVVDEFLMGKVLLHAPLPA